MGITPAFCIVCSLLGFAVAPQDVCPSEDITIASGTLAHHRRPNALLNIDDVWMRVQPDTEFHRRLPQGIDNTACRSTLDGSDKERS